MTEFVLIKEALSAGGDIAIIALLVVMWRFDRRAGIKGKNHEFFSRPRP